MENGNLQVKMHLDNILRAQGKFYVLEKPVPRPKSNSPEEEFTQYFKYLADESDVMSILIFSVSSEFTDRLRDRSCHEVVKDIESQLGFYRHTGSGNHICNHLQGFTRRETLRKDRSNLRRVFVSFADLEDYDGIPDDDVPMWVLRKRQHESTLKELLEKPMANRSSLQQKVNRPYVTSEDFNSSLILQDETMDEQADDRPYWGLKEHDWEDHIRDVGSLADSFLKMREESERVRESMKKSEWLTHSTIQPQVSCPSFKVNSNSNENFLLGQDSYSKMKVEDTWFGKGVELPLQEDVRPNDEKPIEEPPTIMINSMNQTVIEKLAPPIEDSWIQHEVLPPWSDSDDSDEEFSWQVNTTEEYHDDDCLDGLRALMQDDLPEESSSDQTPPQQTVSPPLVNKDESNNGLSFSQGILRTVQGVLAQDPFWEASCQKQLVKPTSLTTYLKDLRPDSRKSDVHSARRQGENRNSKWYATLPGGSHKGKSTNPGS
ncbi:hypothetical protein OSB04_032218 [Centaurea solstitialis]|uniref:Uncharacterized protein n=1 Tax=Centaurea solstitialis TaxID=347529 RepID=A0AA38SNN6_9ASTR|nr:hypothetical protein OSB04_032218 [Centaurea solstitialis]